MATDDDDTPLGEKRICDECFGEPYLKQQIQSGGTMASCAYCERTSQTYPIGAIADYIDKAFEQHFRQVTTYSNDGRDGEPAAAMIGYAAHIDEEPANDIQSILDERYEDFEADKIGEETPFCPDSHYEEADVNDYELRGEWDYFEKSLKSESRFFTSSVHLAQLFGGIDTMLSEGGRPLVVQAGPGTAIPALFRARVFQSTEKLEIALCYPDRELGSPSIIAAAAGRMNARGISVFYGATSEAAAIAEVRPPVGSRVAVARFDITVPLQLLDLTALGEVDAGAGSLFDPAFSQRLERAKFLRSLSRRMTRPVMPDDEAFEYLATQAIADFLATTNKPQLDGILYPSVQASSGLNVVLFHKVSRVAGLDMPEGSKIDAFVDRDPDEPTHNDYFVSEKRPAPRDASKLRPSTFHAFDAASFLRSRWSTGDVREAALQIDLSSVFVHHIQAVAFTYTSARVRRHSSVLAEPPQQLPSPPIDDIDI